MHRACYINIREQGACPNELFGMYVDVCRLLEVPNVTICNNNNKEPHARKKKNRFLGSFAKRGTR